VSRRPPIQSPIITVIIILIRISGVITYSTNLNTSALIRQMSSKLSTSPDSLRILLETDAPYMIPSNLYTTLTLTSPDLKGKKLPLCHTAMIPWTAEFVAGIIEREEWDTERVMKVARENARTVYGV
jgi:TatD DNase family protein